MPFSKSEESPIVIWQLGQCTLFFCWAILAQQAFAKKQTNSKEVTSTIILYLCETVIFQTPFERIFYRHHNKYTNTNTHINTLASTQPFTCLCLKGAEHLLP